MAKIDITKPIEYVPVGGGAPWPCRLLHTDVNHPRFTAAVAYTTSFTNSHEIVGSLCPEEGNLQGLAGYVRNVVVKSSKFQNVYNASYRLLHTVEGASYTSLKETIKGALVKSGYSGVGILESQYEDGEFVGVVFHQPESSWSN